VQRGIDYAAQLLSTAKPDRVEELRRQVDMLVAEDQEIEAKVREKQADVKLAAPVHSLASIQQQLPPDTALLEYHLGGSRSQLWLITGNRLQAFPLPSRSVIEAECGPLIDAFANHVARRSSKGLQLAFEQRLRKVSQLLIGAIGNQPLPGVVIIVPDGILNRVPFAALEWKGDRLGLVRDLVQVPSASFLAAGKRPRPLADFRLSALAVADPVFGPPNQPWPLARLPFTSELDALAARIPAAKRVILRGPDASRQGLARQPLGDFALLHLSTHALIDDQVPELSRVALSMVDDKGKSVDGFLRPYQFAQWRLNGSTVALSACETALGKQVQGEGLLGLTASLFQAGAGHLILSLTPVDAESSSKFFSELYSNSFAPRPATVEHAATLARQTMAASKRWADPYDWATFVVYGRPSGAVGGTR
jgi:CHAT domain-containing protein